jgi:hypothetical protein
MPGGGGQTTDPFALTSMILGILSLLLGWCCSSGFLTAPLAIVFGIVSLVRIKGQPERYSGKGMATVGIVCASLGILVVIGLIVLNVGLSVLGAL